MTVFTVYPAIDLRGGQVVRLSQGDPQRQTTYGQDPAETAKKWLAAGASWLHVVNLDGAFGEQDNANRQALRAILRSGAPVQLGGGLRSLDDIAAALSLGVRRVILGTLAVEAPDLVAEAIARFGAQAIGVGIDARDGRVRVRGWLQETAITPLELAQRLRRSGLRTVIYTNIARDGVGQGVDVTGAHNLAAEAGVSVIAAGGVASLDDVCRARRAGLSGIIIGRALYEGQIDLREALQC